MRHRRNIFLRGGQAGPISGEERVRAELKLFRTAPERRCDHRISATGGPGTFFASPMFEIGMLIDHRLLRLGVLAQQGLSSSVPWLKQRFDRKRQWWVRTPDSRPPSTSRRNWWRKPHALHDLAGADAPLRRLSQVRPAALARSGSVPALPCEIEQ